jgi:hypothetical protein
VLPVVTNGFFPSLAIPPTPRWHRREFGGRCPCCHIGWIVYRHAHEPTMKRTAVPHTPIADIKNLAHDTEGRSLHLNRCKNSIAQCALRIHDMATFKVCVSFAAPTRLHPSVRGHQSSVSHPSSRSSLVVGLNQSVVTLYLNGISRIQT